MKVRLLSDVPGRSTYVDLTRSERTMELAIAAVLEINNLTIVSAFDWCQGVVALDLLLRRVRWRFVLGHGRFCG